MLTTGEIDRIASAVNLLRPDWPTSSLRTLISEKLAQRTRRDVVVALAWVAAESQTLTPARVLEAGPWWQAAAVEARGTSVFVPPKKGEDCPVHAGHWPDNCPGCRADQLTGDTTPARQATDRVNASEWADRIRTQLHGGNT